MPWGDDPLVDPPQQTQRKPAQGNSAQGAGTIESAYDPQAGAPRVEVRPERVFREQVVDFWKGKGVPDHVAEGIADRAYNESGFDPTKLGDGGTSVGLYQHHADRKAKLQELKNWQDPAVQNQFAYSEVTGGDPVASKHWDEIRNAKTREEAARLWDRYFERSAASQRGYGNDPVVSAGNWRVSPRALEYEQGRKDASVRWMSPSDYLAMTPPIGEGEAAPKRRSLARSLALGEDIEAIPTLDVKPEGKRLRVIDQDGRNRAMAAQEAGIDLIPVAVHGAGSGEYAEIQGMRGEPRPFDFAPVAKAEHKPDARFNPYEAAKDVAGRLFGGDQQSVATAAQTRGQQAQARDQAYVNDAGQPFTLSGQPPPQQQPQQQQQPQPGERVPGEIPGVPRLSEMISEIVRGAVEGGERARGIGEAGQNPLRPLSPDTMSAAALGAGLPPGSRMIPAASSNALRQLQPAGQNMLADAGRARAMEFPRPSPISPERAALAQEARDRFGLPITEAEINPEHSLPAAAVRSVPGSGDAPRRLELQRRFNREVAKTIGEDAPAVNQQVMKDARERIGATLERIESNNRVALDNAFLSDVSRAARVAKTSMTDQEYGIILRQVENIYRHIDKNGVITGKTYGNLMKKGAALDRAASNANPNIAQSAQELQEAMRDVLQRNLSGKDLAEYRTARYQWKNLKTIEPLVEKNPQGDISPALLSGQVSKHFKNRAYDVSGTELDRLGKIGQAFLKEPRSSGTTERGAPLWAIGKGAAAIGALATGHFAGLPLLEEMIAAGTFIGGARMMSGYLARPAQAEKLIRNALTRLPRTPGDKRNAIAAMLSGRGAQTLLGPPQP